MRSFRIRADAKLTNRSGFVVGPIDACRRTCFWFVFIGRSVGDLGALNTTTIKGGHGAVRERELDNEEWM